MLDSGVDLVSASFENTEEQKAEDSLALGKFSEVIFGGGGRREAAYYAGISRFLHGDDGYTDIDVCSTGQGAREVYARLGSEEVKRELKVKGLKIRRGELPPILGEEGALLHVECTIQPGRRVIPVDVWADFGADRLLRGIRQEISLDSPKDIRRIPIKYASETGAFKKIMVPTLSLEAQGDIDRILSQRERYYLGDVLGMDYKDRTHSLSKIYDLNSFTVSHGAGADQRVAYATARLGSCVV